MTTFTWYHHVHSSPPSRDPWPDGEGGAAELDASLAESSVPVGRGLELSHELRDTVLGDADGVAWQVQLVGECEGDLRCVGTTAAMRRRDDSSMSPEPVRLAVHGIRGHHIDAAACRALVSEARNGCHGWLGGGREWGEDEAAVDAFRGEDEVGAELLGDGAGAARWARSREVSHPPAGDAANRVSAVGYLVI